jgi:F-box and WD-40 domain protein 1/11
LELKKWFEWVYYFVVLKEDIISELPAEISIKIMSLATSDRDNCQMALVSKKWHELSCDNDVWKAIYISKYGRSKAQILNPKKSRKWKDLYIQRRKLSKCWRGGLVMHSILIRIGHQKGNHSSFRFRLLHSI